MLHGGPETFATVTSEQAGTLLAAHIASDGTAYFAGGVTGGGGGLLVRWDGRTATTIPTPDARAFWWIHGVSDGEMWLAGEAGEVHRFDGTTLTRVDAGAPAGTILFGIWGAGTGDLGRPLGGRRLVHGRGTAAGDPARLGRELVAGARRPRESILT